MHALTPRQSMIALVLVDRQRQSTDVLISIAPFSWAVSLTGISPRSCVRAPIRNGYCTNVYTLVAPIGLATFLLIWTG